MNNEIKQRLEEYMQPPTDFTDCPELLDLLRDSRTLIEEQETALKNLRSLSNGTITAGQLIPGFNGELCDFIIKYINQTLKDTPQTVGEEREK